MTRDKTDPHIELGEEVSAEGRPRSVLLAVRVPVELAERIQTHAAARGISVSEILRRGAVQITSGLASSALAESATYEARLMLSYDNEHNTTSLDQESRATVGAAG